MPPVFFHARLLRSLCQCLGLAILLSIRFNERGYGGDICNKSTSLPRYKEREAPTKWAWRKRGAEDNHVALDP